MYPPVILLPISHRIAPEKKNPRSCYSPVPAPFPVLIRIPPHLEPSSFIGRQTIRRIGACLVPSSEVTVYVYFKGHLPFRCQPDSLWKVLLPTRISSAAETRVEVHRPPSFFTYVHLTPHSPCYQIIHRSRTPARNVSRWKIRILAKGNLRLFRAQLPPGRRVTTVTGRAASHHRATGLDSMSTLPDTRPGVLGISLILNLTRRASGCGTVYRTRSANPLRKVPTDPAVTCTSHP